MPSAAVAEKKQVYLTYACKLFREFSQCIMIGADNVGSKQIQQIRASLRGRAVLLMGKNTLLRKAIRSLRHDIPDLEGLIPHIRGNVGLLFTSSNLNDVKKVLADFKVAAPAKAGAMAPVDVIVPAGPTGMEPTMTSFLQALDIASKIVKGQVEITSDVHLIKKDTKVGGSEAVLLQKLKVFPFFYGLEPLQVYDNGTIYEAKVLDLSDDDIIASISAGIARVACVSLATSFPSMAAIPHCVQNGYKRVLAVALATDLSFEKADALKAFLADPNAMAAAAAAATAPAAGGAAAPAAAKKEEPVEEEEEADMGFDLFD